MGPDPKPKESLKNQAQLLATAVVQEAKADSAESENKRNQELYDKVYDDYLKRTLSNSENYDRTVVTVVSAVFTLSLGFAGRDINLKNAQGFYYLYTGWFMLVVSLLIVVLSFDASDKGLAQHLKNAEQTFFSARGDSTLEPKTHWGRALLPYSRFGSTFCLLAGLILLAVFVGINLGK